MLNYIQKLQILISLERLFLKYLDLELNFSPKFKCIFNVQ